MLGSAQAVRLTLNVSLCCIHGSVGISRLDLCNISNVGISLDDLRQSGRPPDSEGGEFLLITE